MKFLILILALNFLLSLCTSITDFFAHPEVYSRMSLHCRRQYAIVYIVDRHEAEYVNIIRLASHICRCNILLPMLAIVLQKTYS